MVGGDITLSPVAISHGDLTIEITNENGEGTKPAHLQFLEQKTSLNDLVKAKVDKKTPRGGIVHRLDRTTSGVMIVAKNKLTHELLTEQFKQRSVNKEVQS